MGRFEMRTDEEFEGLLAELSAEHGLSRAEVVKQAVRDWGGPQAPFELSEGEKEYVRAAAVASRREAVAKTRFLRDPKDCPHSIHRGGVCAACGSTKRNGKWEAPAST